MSDREYEDFMKAGEDEILCDERFCPFFDGSHGAPGETCEGKFCEEAWDNYCEEQGKEYAQ